MKNWFKGESIIQRASCPVRPASASSPTGFRRPMPVLVTSGEYYETLIRQGTNAIVLDSTNLGSWLKHYTVNVVHNGAMAGHGNDPETGESLELFMGLVDGSCLVDVEDGQHSYGPARYGFAFIGTRRQMAECFSNGHIILLWESWQRFVATGE